MVLRCMQNSGHGGPHMTRVMTMFVFYVNPPIPNIEKIQLYEVYKYRGAFECHRNHVWGPIFDPSYDHIHKCDHFG